jgi:hypothetical protein
MAERLFVIPGRIRRALVLRHSRDGAVRRDPDQDLEQRAIEHRLQEQEKLLMAAQLDALASQINPHFLFNTLTSISSLIRSQPKRADADRQAFRPPPATAQEPGILRARFARNSKRSTSISISKACGSGRSSGREAHRPATLDLDRAEHAAAAAD